MKRLLLLSLVMALAVSVSAQTDTDVPPEAYTLWESRVQAELSRVAVERPALELPEPAFGAQAASLIPSSILNGLARGGVNLQFDAYDPNNFAPQNFYPELPLIAAAGAGHVRLPLSFESIGNNNGSMKMDRYAAVVAFVRQAQASGLITIIDVHNTSFLDPNGSGNWNEDYMGGLRNANKRQAHLTLLTNLARQLYTDNVPRDTFVIQPANEPIFGSDPNVWYNHQRNLLPAMRTACPDCIIFAMANDWQGVEATIWNIDPSQAPYNDGRLIFDMHFYEPISLSHCQYPGQPDNCPGQQYPGTHTTWRGTQIWNRAQIVSLLQDMFAWKNAHRVTVHFSEIGTTAALDQTTRARYLGDVTGILREQGIGFTLYEWHRNFGIKQHPQVVSAAFAGGVVVVPTPTPLVTNTPRPTRTPQPIVTPLPTATFIAVTPTPDDFDALVEQLATLRTQRRDLRATEVEVDALLADNRAAIRAIVEQLAALE